MIQSEKITIDNRVFTHTYSDVNLKIKREDGAVFDEAYDVLYHAYTETDIPIEVDDGEEH